MGTLLYETKSERRGQTERQSFLSLSPAPHSSHSHGHDLTATTAGSVSVSVFSGKFFFLCLEVGKSLRGHSGHLQRPLQEPHRKTGYL